MSLTFLGWLLIASSIAISAHIAVSLQSRGPRNEPFDLDAWLRSSRTTINQALRETGGTLMITAAVFVLVAGIGTAISYRHNAVVTTDIEDTDDEILARLGDYARSAGGGGATSKAAGGELLPDVNTMIEQLQSRLVAAPEDAQGWRMLGWSYFNTGRYDEASTAYAKAVALDPDSAELKLAYEEAKAKTSNAATPNAAALQAATVANGPAGEKSDKTKPAASPPHAGGDAVLAMVERLADRLEKDPRDVEGWTRLMRSRVVLGDRGAAATAFRKARELFKDEPAASQTISAAAGELGLKPE